MKATGIVRRIDAGVIITPRVIKPHKYWGFRAIFIEKFLTKAAYFDLYIKKAR